VLDLPSAARIIRAFIPIKTDDSALEVYKRTIAEVALNDKLAAADFFLAILEAPAMTQTPFEVLFCFSPLPYLILIWCSSLIGSCSGTKW
jgi:hypothetical protein